MTASNSGASEQQNAVALNDYATRQRISYSLEIRRRSDSSVIRMDELDEVLGDELSVVILLNDHGGKTILEPVDNKNILVLLRE